MCSSLAWPGPAAKMKPLEAESPSSWMRMCRSRSPAHKMPNHMLPAAYVAHHAGQLRWLDRTTPRWRDARHR